MTRALDAATAPLVRLVGFTGLCLLLTAHELLARQPRAYLAPLRQAGPALLCSALGAGLGFLLARWTRHAQRPLPGFLLALSVFCPISIAAYLFAFERPELWGLARFSLPALGATLIAASATALIQSFADAKAPLGLVERLLTPRALVVGLLVLLLGAGMAAHLGLLRSSLTLGVLWALFAFRMEGALSFLWGGWPKGATLRGAGALASALTNACVLVLTSSTISTSEVAQHASAVVFAAGEGRDRVVMTSGQNAFTLFVGNSLRWSTLDGDRYSEALVAPAVALAPSPRACLVLGGSEGLLVRRLLDSARCASITVVTPEAAVVRLSSRLLPLAAANRGAFANPRVKVVLVEALPWLEEQAKFETRYALATVNLPDPTDGVTGKNYTRFFYERLRSVLAKDGVVTVQAAPLLRAPRVFENVASTLSAAGFAVAPYEAELPSLGLWGFLLATPRDAPLAARPGPSPRLEWPPVDSRLPLRPSARDTEPASLDAPPTRLNDLRVVRLLTEARDARSAP